MGFGEFCHASLLGCALDLLMNQGKILATRLGRRPERRHRTGSPRRFVADDSAEGAMFPIIESTLSFGEIADYWSREIPASWDEILRILESAWWQDKLRGNSGPTRLQRLKNMFNSMRHRDDLGVVYCGR